MMIKIDSNNIITAWCTVGGIEGGLSVGNIPEEVKTAPIGYYKYVGGKFAINTSYAEPTEEPTLSVGEKIIEIQSKIDLLNQSVDLLVLDTL